jgi:hypothetical protein
MDIRAWLRSLGLESYEAAFRANAIDETVLPSLTADDLKELGVATVGHRRKLLERLRPCVPVALDATFPRLSRISTRHRRVPRSDVR